MNNELLAIELVKRLGGTYEKRGNSVIYISAKTGLSYVCRKDCLDFRQNVNWSSLQL